MKEIKKVFKNKKARNIFLSCVLAIVIIMTTPEVFATEDPLQIINNLSDFVFSVIRGIGGIILAFGIVQFGMSFKSQDPSQRMNGIMSIAGGVIIVCSKEILNIITK